MRAWVIAVCLFAIAGPAAAQDTKPAAPDKIGGRTIVQWCAELKNGDPSKRANALMALMQFEDASTAVPDVIAILKGDPDISPRAKACLVLRTITVKRGEQVKHVVDALATRLWKKQESETVVRFEAAQALRRFAPDAASAIPALINGTLDRNCWEVRHSCAGTLWRAAIDPDGKKGPDPRAVRALIDLIKQDRSTYLTRLEAITGLGAMGRPADPLQLNEVLELLENAARAQTENIGLKLWAYAALVMMDDAKRTDVALNALGRYLIRNPDDKNSVETRVQAAGALAALGQRAKKRVPDLIKMLADPDPLVAQAASAALAGIGDKSDQVIDALLSLLTAEKDPKRAGAAVVGLVNLRAGEPRVLAAMSKLRENKGLDINFRKLLEDAEKEFDKQAKEPKKDKK